LNQIRHILLCFTILLLSASIAKATHYRAGEINYRYIGINNFEIIVITYTDPANTGADRKEMEVFFGDNKSEIVPRSNGNGEIVNSDINNTIKKNIYRTTHSYPGPGNYIIRITDPNRIDGIKNINGGRSVDIAFYVESVLTIAAGIGNNQSPILLLPPIDVGCVNEIFTHNPAAYDPDGDSLAFTIIAPKMAQGMEVPRFTIPQFSDSFNISVNNGQLTWHKPVQEGFYNWAIRINEYRGGILIGYVVRDMQVYINNNCDNSPPKLTVPQFTCVEANQLVQGTISANDPNSGQRVKLQYYGSPFVQKNSPATLSPTSPEGPSSGFSATFNWRPSCNAIKYYPHIAVFRAVDNHVTKPLADIKFWNIKVVGPSPKNVRIVQDSNGFILNWDRDTCKMAFGYKIYRKIDSSYWKHAKCETGVPEYSKFSLYDTTRGLNNTTYFDNNGGKGISPLIRYCYLITSWYYQRNEDGIIIVIGEKTESYASDEVCGIILKTKPIITKVSVEKTGTSNGMININWVKPEVLDSTQNKPPYQVQLQRSTSALGVYQNIGKAIDYPSYASLKDESVDDSLLNTTNTTYYYRVMMYGTKNGTPKLIETSTIAGSPRLSILNTNRTAVLNWKADVPWINKQYVIYKKNALNTFDSITSTKELFFADTGLINGNTYCYFIETKGNYDTLYYPFLIRNKSQEACGIPIDTIRPCAPILTIDTPCNSFTVLQVKLNWVYPKTCEKDVVKYRIYWKKNVKESWKILDSVPFSVNQYIDDRIALKLSIAGCYVVVAVDSFNNESYFTNEHCINNCPFYDIPNVFTPNGDGKNDYLIPFPYRFIDKVDLIIYNRWGQEVFVTNNIDIYWNGNDQKTGNECSEGVYFFIADVYESYLEGTKKRTIRGTINIIR
jgi:gliding motility-associated-like protein